jgi:hypothetical protein
MFNQLQATYLALSKWSQNPAATKKQIGVWRHWQETEDNDRPLSSREIERMKAILRQGAPTSYFELFAEEETDR